MKRRWLRWKRRQPSLVVFVLVPYGSRITSSGRLVHTQRILEVELP